MIITVFIGNAKPDRDEIQEGFMGQFRTTAFKIFGNVELQLINARAHFVAREKRRIGAPVQIGDNALQEFRRSAGAMR